MAEEGVVLDGEESGSSMNPELQTQQLEQKARAKGWKPQEEWKGDPEDWVPAKEYLGRQKLYDRISDLKGELGRQARKFESDLSTITQYFEKMREADYERAKASIREELRAARRNDDIDAEEAAERKLEKLEQEREQAKQAAAAKAAQQQQQGPTPEFQEWASRNTWFQKDLDMTQDAIAIGTGYAAANPNKSQYEVLQYVEQRIQKMYPEKFEGAQGDEEPSPKHRSAPAVESGNGGKKPVSSQKKGKITVADLDPEAREIMRVLVKRGALKQKAAKNGISQEEQYLRDYQESLEIDSVKAPRR